MIVAVIPVRVMQMPIDQIVDVIAMRHRLVAASRAMLVRRVVTCARVRRRAGRRVLRRHLDHMLVDMIAMRMVQMAVVQVVDMPIVPHGRMSAPGPVRMGVICVSWIRTVGHFALRGVRSPAMRR